MGNFPVRICVACGEIISNQDDSFHGHHDSVICPWIPPDDADLDVEILLHEILCQHKKYYHDRCCRYCSQEMAGV